MVFTTLFSLCLLAMAAGWIAWHIRVWRVTRRTERDESERLFQWRRFRRRVQASGMLALAAVAIGLGQWIEPKAHPTFFLGYWMCVLVSVLWLGALALADAVATRLHAQKRLGRLAAEQAGLEAELNRIQHQRAEAEQGTKRNGKAR